MEHALESEPLTPHAADGLTCTQTAAVRAAIADNRQLAEWVARGEYPIA